MSNRTVEQGKVVAFNVNGSEYRGLLMSVKQYGSSEPKANVACFDGGLRKVLLSELRPSRLPNGVSLQSIMSTLTLGASPGDTVSYKGEECTVLELFPAEGKVRLSAPWSIKRPYGEHRLRTSKKTTKVYANRCTFVSAAPEATQE